MAGASEATTRRKSCSDAIAQACVALGDAGFKPHEITAAMSEILMARLIVSAEQILQVKLDEQAVQKTMLRGAMHLRGLLVDVKADVRAAWEAQR